MKLITYILTIIFLVGFIQAQRCKNDLKGFNNFLGHEKASALNDCINSFDNFINNNYVDYKNTNKRIRTFLEQLSNSYIPDSTWILETEENKKILNRFEKSGMRKEIWLYGYEDYEIEYISENNNTDTQKVVNFEIEEEIIPVTRQVDTIDYEKLVKELKSQHDSSLWSNIMGQFLYGLSKYAPHDPDIQSYVEAKQMAGNIASELVVNAFLKEIKNYNEPFIKRIIFVEFYYNIMKWDIERKK